MFHIMIQVLTLIEHIMDILTLHGITPIVQVGLLRAEINPREPKPQVNGMAIFLTG